MKKILFAVLIICFVFAGHAVNSASAKAVEISKTPNKIQLPQRNDGYEKQRIEYVENRGDCCSYANNSRANYRGNRNSNASCH
ncbi:MAG: hypothetical protein LBT79_08480 [Elusimicrobiota bacterium]|jgi:hypothetical protein|nr:hypothetical protein [Elusimicrobiota bacterium]